LDVKKDIEIEPGSTGKGIWKLGGGSPEKLPRKRKEGGSNNKEKGG